MSDTQGLSEGGNPIADAMAKRHLELLMKTGMAAMSDAPSFRPRFNHRGAGGVLIDDSFRRQCVEFAARTNIKNAARKFGVSSTNIGKWMHAFGVQARPTGRPTDAEFQQYEKEYIAA